MSNADKPARIMSTERPLDALLPELGTARALPFESLHPRVLEVDVEGELEFVFTCWRSPGDPRSLHSAVKRLVEATLLAELSQRPRDVAAAQRTIGGLRLICFDDVGPATASAVHAFGFRPAAYAPERYLARMSVLADEAELLGFPLPERPESVWHAPVLNPQGVLGERLAALEREMATRMKDDVWGATPGGPSRFLTRLAEAELGGALRANLEGMERLERWLVRREVGPIRWIRPLLFQALCDYVGVVAQAAFRADVQWAECAPDETGLAPPPLLRVRRGSQFEHVPVGLHVLRWCVMPLTAGEAVPTLAEWMVDQFAAAQA